MTKQKNIAILGSTGSIGTQALDVIQSNSDMFTAYVLTAQRNVELLIEQAVKFKPKHVVIGDESKVPALKNALAKYDIEIHSGENALNEIVTLPEIDIVLTALVGYAGLIPTIKAIESKKTIALANKETLVVAGGLIMALAKKHGVDIIPVDSEHSAIFQCLVGEFHNPIEKIILTASGGPFRGKSKEYLQTVTKAQALKHPNWEMGAKITIDSATMMNKGLEVIEAKWLFDIEIDQVEVIVHPQSIVHSLVQFTDGSIKAQLGLPDMHLPIQFALTYPDRFQTDFPRFDFANFPSLTFEKPDMEVFRNLHMAFEAAKKGGNLPCVLNAANEIAVAEFLRERISFTEISEVVEKCLSKINYIETPNLDNLILTDRETRILANEFIN
ncbi:1-deoxy-D-xylulose-5-phosphate reductoisomerase [Fulvivirgaceae bacterium LMO-SS25]